MMKKDGTRNRFMLRGSFMESSEILTLLLSYQKDLSLVPRE